MKEPEQVVRKKREEAVSECISIVRNRKVRPKPLSRRGTRTVPGSLAAGSQSMTFYSPAKIALREGDSAIYGAELRKLLPHRIYVQYPKGKERGGHGMEERRCKSSD